MPILDSNMILKLVIFCLEMVTSLTAVRIKKIFIYFKGSRQILSKGSFMIKLFKYWNYEILQYALENNFWVQNKSLLI